MTQDKYIGIENELTSFENNKIEGFNSKDFNNLLKDEYFKISDTSIRSNTGNGYYIDGSEIEIITPPIALNKGFSTRLTNALIIGRNYVIENTPDMSHTGYSMHWNLSHDNNNFNLGENNRNNLINDLCVPFQLFGLTPLSCGFNVRTNKNDSRYEVIGDSIVNLDQINATALLLGAYCQAIERTPLKQNHFPIHINESIYTSNLYGITHLVKNGRYSKINTLINNNNNKIIKAQNILELFYDWLSPFVYKLGERDEINNLEAFIKGEKKLEIDESKYFKALENKKGINMSGTYKPIEIQTTEGVRSQILKTTTKNNLEVPLEGKLLGIYAINTKPSDIFITSSMDWGRVKLKVILNKKIAISDSKINDTYTHIEIIEGVNDIYDFAKEYQLIINHSELDSSKEGTHSTDTTNIQTKTISESKINKILRKKIKYKFKKDPSALIK